MTSNKETTNFTQAEKDKQDQLKHQVDYLSFILKRSSEMIAVLDTHFRVMMVNPSYKRGFKTVLRQEPQPGLFLHEILISDELDKEYPMWARALNGGEFIHVSTIPVQDEQKKYELSFACLRNQYGEIIGASLQARDITGELNSQQPDNPTEAFSMLANTMAQLVWTCHRDGQADFINKRSSQYTGKSPKELMQEGWHSWLHPDELPVYLKNLETFRPEKEFFEQEVRLQAADGSYRWFILKIVALTFSENTQSKFLCTATDIHEQKMLLDRLEQKAQELEHITEAIPQLVWTTEANGWNLYFNQRWYEYTGLDYTRSMKKGWSGSLHPDDKKRTLAAWKHSLATGEHYKIEYRFRRHDGAFRWFIGQAVPMYNKEGEIIRWFGTCTDIHDQKLQRDELNEKNQKLFQINRYLDEFVHAVAHDLRSPVAGLKLSFELLNQVEEEKRDKILNGCQTYLDRLDNTLKGLVQLIEVQEDPSQTHYEEFDIQQVIEQVVQDLAEKLNQANARVKHGDFQWRTISYPKPYIYNILRNIIRYALRFKDPEKPLDFNISSWQQNGFMLIRIEENGPGINLEKELKNLFKPFSHINKGSDRQGMGLAIVKHMVEKNGGKIQVESSLGQGTKFDIYLKEYTQIQ